MTFVFSQPGDDKIGTWIWVDYFGSNGTGLRVENTQSFPQDFLFSGRAWNTSSYPTLILFIILLWLCLDPGVRGSVSGYYSKGFTLSCLLQEESFLPAPLVLGLSMWLLALASFWAEYIIPKFDFETSQVTFLGQWGISRCDGSRGWKCAWMVGLILLSLCHHRE